MKAQLNHIKKSYGTQEVLLDASLRVRDKEKIALIGRNGCGKTTLLRILCGQEQADAGDRFIAGDTRIGYLAQITFPDESCTVYEELLKAFAEVRHLEQAMRETEQQLQEQADEKILSRYADMQARFEAMNGYQYDVEIRNVFFHFQFEEADLQKKLSEFSSGQKTRIALVKLLLSKPDILLLDEPTNHLDLQAVEWLENYLRHYPFAVVLVSHDRTFIDHVADEIVEIEYGKTMRYVGSYTHYTEAKKEYLQKNHEAYVRQQQEIKRLEELIAKFRSKSSKASFAQSKQKYLDRMERIQDVRADEQMMHASFSSGRKGGRRVLKVEHLSIGYDHPLAEVNVELMAGQRLAVIGPNGTGKSTLLKTLIGQLPALSGHYAFGHQIDVGYFDQESAQMSSDKTVLDELWDRFPLSTQTEIRNTLAAFLFTQDEVFKEVNDLSGGEKVRLALACLMLRHDNLLILDEPTNHLDIPGKEALENALQAYDGTLLFVSHDRMFLQKMATRVLDLGSGAKVFDLGYQDYMDHSTEDLQPSEIEKPQTGKAKFQNEKALRNRIAKLENMLEEAEKDLESLRELRYEPEFYQDFKKMETLDADIDDKHNEIQKLMSEWEEKMEELEGK